MKKKLLNIFVVMAVSPLLSQCATRSDLEQVRYQLRIVNKKIEDMKSTTVDQLQKRQALASGQVEQLEQDIMKLRGQLEETYFLNQRLREQNKELEISISNVAEQEGVKREETLRKMELLQQEKEVQLTELNNKLALQQESVKAIQQARIKDAERKVKDATIAAQLAKSRTRAASAAASNKGNLQHIMATKKKVTKSVVAPPRSPIEATTSGQAAGGTTPVTPVKNTTEQIANPTTTPAVDNYKKAESLYAQNKYSQALPIFQQIASQQNSANSVEARYMMGECLFAQKDYDKAIMQFQKIISQHSNHPKAPSAMLKQGMAFESLSDKDTAKVIYKKLLKKHGDSAEAGEARERLGKI